MKKFILIPLLLNHLYGEMEWTITCPGDESGTSISTLHYAFSGEWNDETTVYGELDTCNFTMPFWDISSPACGGSGTSNILVEKYNGACDDSSFIFTVGDVSGFTIHKVNPETSEYENNVILVNGYPCMPQEETSMTVAFYDWNNNGNIGLVTAHNLNNTGSITNYELTEQEVSALKSICKTADPNAEIDYTPYLNQIIDNTASNPSIPSSLEDMNSREQQRDNDLNSFISDKDIDTMMNIDTDLETFNTTFETTLSDTYSTYGDIFGFGGYGATPSPISFSMLGRSYNVFDPSVLNPYIDLIRNTFAIFAYLWGFIVVFRNI